MLLHERDLHVVEHSLPAGTANASDGWLKDIVSAAPVKLTPLSSETHLKDAGKQTIYFGHRTGL